MGIVIRMTKVIKTKVIKTQVVKTGAFKTSLVLLLSFGLLSACAVNPVTGKQELSLVSEQQEISIGKKNYLPAQQSQGGEYTIDKELTEYVNGVGQQLVKVSDRPNLPYEFVVLNNGVPNAWALPGGKIALNRGLLLELNNEAELAAVMSHEVVHAAARHGAKSLERGILFQVGLIGVGAAAADEDNSRFIVGAASVSAALISKKYGRNAELESDRYGMEYMVRVGYNPEAAVTLQETFVRLSEGKEGNWLEGLFASHPPSQERVAANRQRAQELGAKGKLGAEEYQAKIAHLKKTKPAYDAYEQGQKALKEKKPDEALELAAKAIEIEPREALFYSLQGEAWKAKGDKRKAEESFSRAVEHNSQHFLPYLQRGLMRAELAQDIEAEQDLRASTELLATAPAYLGLGDLAQKAGKEEMAIGFYRQASDSKTATGQQALAKLARLDLPQNPGDYLKVQAGLSQRGTMILRINNQAGVDVKNVRLHAAFSNTAGKTALEKSLHIENIIATGQSLAVDTGLTPPPGTNLRLQILAAEIAN